MSLNKTVVLLALALSLTACTDAARDKLTSYSSPARVQCYSGGNLIYDGVSTGKLLETADSDGYNLRDNKTNDLVQVTGDCVVTYLD